MKRSAVLVCLALSYALAGCVTETPHRIVPLSPPAQMPTYAAGTCQTELLDRGGHFRSIADRNYGSGCATIDSVRLLSVRSDEGNVTLSGLGPLSCTVALKAAAWVQYGVDRAARAELGSPVVSIETLGSYACRNVANSDRRSAHATANAIDVSAFDLADGRKISVLRGWTGGTSSERRFLRLVAKSACRRFSTVLDPDYNEVHRDHLHLELGASHFCR